MSRSINPTATEVVPVSDNARVYVQDTDAGYVRLTPEIGPAGTSLAITPEQARAVAALLVASADRMEKQGDSRFTWNSTELEK